MEADEEQQIYRRIVVKLLSAILWKLCGSCPTERHEKIIIKETTQWLKAR